MLLTDRFHRFDFIARFNACRLFAAGRIYRQTLYFAVFPREIKRISSACTKPFYAAVFPLLGECRQKLYNIIGAVTQHFADTACVSAVSVHLIRRMEIPKVRRDVFVYKLTQQNMLCCRPSPLPKGLPYSPCPSPNHLRRSFGRSLCQAKTLYKPR